MYTWSTGFACCAGKKATRNTRRFRCMCPSKGDCHDVLLSFSRSFFWLLVFYFILRPMIAYGCQCNPAAGAMYVRNLFSSMPWCCHRPHPHLSQAALPRWRSIVLYLRRVCGPMGCRNGNNGILLCALPRQYTHSLFLSTSWFRKTMGCANFTAHII